MIAYRNAKVILTTLPDSAKQPWLKRMQSAFAALHSSPLIKLLLRTDLGNYRSTHDLLMTISKAFFDGNIAQHAMMSYKIHEGESGAGVHVHTNILLKSGVQAVFEGL